MQNAMNAAEITDKLGLHSLRQRAWVGLVLFTAMDVYANTLLSIFNQHVLRLAMGCTKDWNG